MVGPLRTRLQEGNRSTFFNRANGDYNNEEAKQYDPEEAERTAEFYRGKHHAPSTENNYRRVVAKYRRMVIEAHKSEVCFIRERVDDVSISEDVWSEVRHLVHENDLIANDTLRK